MKKKKKMDMMKDIQINQQMSRTWDLRLFQNFGWRGSRSFVQGVRQGAEGSAGRERSLVGWTGQDSRGEPRKGRAVLSVLWLKHAAETYFTSSTYLLIYLFYFHLFYFFLFYWSCQIVSVELSSG